MPFSCIGGSRKCNFLYRGKCFVYVVNFLYRGVKIFGKGGKTLAFFV